MFKRYHHHSMMMLSITGCPVPYASPNGLRKTDQNCINQRRSNKGLGSVGYEHYLYVLWPWLAGVEGVGLQVKGSALFFSSGGHREIIQNSPINGVEEAGGGHEPERKVSTSHACGPNVRWWFCWRVIFPRSKKNINLLQAEGVYFSCN